MLVFLGLVNAAMVFVGTLLIYNNRAGFGEVKTKQSIDWREFLLANPAYFGLTLIKSLFWWAVLIYWLANGRRGSPWRAVNELDGREVRRVMRISAV